jgi:UDP-N-acetylglucosamine--N-acetylmuramyl-(pentapeptide) pyrophosphoryl-undecaprenol N-acetylglucosamine transferase
MEDAMPRIVIAAGGTAGHVVPALAVADALRARGAHVEFIGGERAESELIPAAGYPFHRVRVRGLDRTRPVRAALALLLAAGATLRAMRLLRRLGADAVLGGGGYVAGPVGLAARLTGRPLVLTEADSHLGVTNRCWRRSPSVCSWPSRSRAAVGSGAGGAAAPRASGW